MNERTKVINRTIKMYGYASYLEIGVRNPADNFDLIECDYKVGVDPKVDHKQILKMSSDVFFQGVYSIPFGLIFIDGDHSQEQSERDYLNALDLISVDGSILLHDIYPEREEYTGDTKPADGRPWHGNVYKTWWNVFTGNPKARFYKTANIGAVYCCDPTKMKQTYKRHDITFQKYKELIG